jgi:hypothetical protein
MTKRRKNKNGLVGQHGGGSKGCGETSLARTLNHYIA